MAVYSVLPVSIALLVAGLGLLRKLMGKVKYFPFGESGRFFRDVFGRQQRKI